MIYPPVVVKEETDFEYTVILEMIGGYVADNQYGNPQSGISLDKFQPSWETKWRREFGHVTFYNPGRGNRETLIGIEEESMTDKAANAKCLELLIQLPDISNQREHWIKRRSTTALEKIDKPKSPS